MTSLDLNAHQTASMVAYVGALAKTCVVRFRDSALLVGADLNQWPPINEFFTRHMNLDRLVPFWTRVCFRYNRDIYDPQLAISFAANDIMNVGSEGICEDLIFSRFIHWRLWPIIASENECVRNVLRSVDFLPNQNPQQAVKALVLYIDELVFSADMYRPNLGYFE